MIAHYYSVSMSLFYLNYSDDNQRFAINGCISYQHLYIYVCLSQYLLRPTFCLLNKGIEEGDFGLKIIYKVYCAMPRHFHSSSFQSTRKHHIFCKYYS